MPIFVVLGLDIQDEMGRHEVGMSDATTKEPIFSHGIEGCLFQSHFMINKVSRKGLPVTESFQVYIVIVQKPLSFS